MDPMNPDAQGQTEQPDAADPEIPSGNAPDDGQSKRMLGIEKRMGELTAARREAERQAAAKDAQIQELLQTVNALTSRVVAPVNTEPPPEIDPERRREVEYLVAPQMRNLQSQVAQMSQQLAQKEFNEALVQYGGTPELATEAQQLMTSWQRAGLQGWKSEDAVVYAAGKMALKERGQATRANGQAAQFNDLGEPLTGHMAAPVARTNANAELPANFDSLPPEKQEAILEQRLAGKAW